MKRHTPTAAAQADPRIGIPFNPYAFHQLQFDEAYVGMLVRTDDGFTDCLAPWVLLVVQADRGGRLFIGTRDGPVFLDDLAGPDRGFLPGLYPLALTPWGNPVDPDPECPWCSGEGFVGDRWSCACANWNRYGELRRTKGLTMRQAIQELEGWAPAWCRETFWAGVNAK